MYSDKSIILLIGFILISSCVSKSKFTSLEREHQILKEEFEMTNQSLYATQEEKAQLTMTAKQLQSDLKAVKEKLNFTESMMESLKSSGAKPSISAPLKVNQSPKIKDSDKKIKPSVVAMSYNEYDYYRSEESVNFYSGSIIVANEDKSFLKAVARQFLENPEAHFIIEGHADHIPVKKGSRYRDNWDLSTQRAQSVAHILIEFGVNPSQFTVVGKSDTEPIVKGYSLSSEDLAKNRRVEIVPQTNRGVQKSQLSAGPSVLI